MRSVRRWLVGSVIAAAAVACGLDLTGVAPIALDAGVDGSTRDASTDPPVDAGESRDGEGERDAGEAGPACDAGLDSFCDYCNPNLVLCIQFEGGVRDESMYRRELEVDGAPPSFVFVDGGEGAITLDGSTTFRLREAPELTFAHQLTLEVRAKLRTVPGDKARFGLVDGERLSGFIYGGGQRDASTDKPHLRCSNVDSPEVMFRTDEFMHFACVANHDTDRIGGYVSGQRVIDFPDAADFVHPFPDGGWTDQIVLFANSPSLDDFQGEIASVRIFVKARSPDQIARAAGDAGDAGD